MPACVSRQSTDVEAPRSHFNPYFDLNGGGQDGQNENRTADHSASLGDSMLMQLG